MKKKKKSQGQELPYTQRLRKERKEAEFWKKFGFTDPEMPLPEHIEWVKFSFTSVSDEDLGIFVSRIRSVDMLDLKDTAISVEGIRHLCQMEHIGELRLKESYGINDECLELIAKIKGLHFLQLTCTSISYQHIHHLAALKSLKTLLLPFDNDDVEVRNAVKHLQEQLPGCEICIDGKPFPRSQPFNQ